MAASVVILAEVQHGLQSRPPVLKMFLRDACGKADMYTVAPFLREGIWAVGEFILKSFTANAADPHHLKEARGRIVIIFCVDGFRGCQRQL